MTQPPVSIRLCRYPGCERPAVPPEGGAPGRPPGYCDDPDHTRASAWRARHTEQAAAAGRAAPEDLGRPVTMAKARAETIAAQVGSQVRELTTALGQVVDELRTLGDPDAAAAQIETVTAEADQRIAESVARSARAEQDRRVAEQQREEADAAAEEALQQLDITARQLADLQTAHRAMADELAQARAAHAEEVEAFRAQTERLAAELARTATDLDRARTAAQEAQDGAADLRTRHATLAVELTAAVQRFEDERAHTEARLADQRSNYDARIAELREELRQERSKGRAAPGNP